MSRVYLYAIVPAAESPPVDVAGVWPDEPQVRIIRGDTLAACGQRGASGRFPRLVARGRGSLTCWRINASSRP